MSCKPYVAVAVISAFHIVAGVPLFRRTHTHIYKLPGFIFAPFLSPFCCRFRFFCCCFVLMWCVFVYVNQCLTSMFSHFGIIVIIDSLTRLVICTILTFCHPYPPARLRTHAACNNIRVSGSLQSNLFRLTDNDTVSWYLHFAIITITIIIVIAIVNIIAVAYTVKIEVKLAENSSPLFIKCTMFFVCSFQNIQIRTLSVVQMPARSAFMCI